MHQDRTNTVFFHSFLYSVWKDPPPYDPLLHFPPSPIQCLKGPSSLPSITSLLPHTVSERTLLPTIHCFTSLLPPYSVWKDPPPYHPLLPSFPIQCLKGPSSLPSITSLPSFPHSVWKWKDPSPYHPLLHFPPSPIVSESERTLLPTIHYFTSLLPPTASERTLLPTIHYFTSLLPPYSVWKDRLLYHPLLHFPPSPIQCLKGPSSLPSITSLPSFPHSVWKWKDPPPYDPFLLHFPPSPIQCLKGPSSLPSITSLPSFPHTVSERTLLPTIHYLTSLLPPLMSERTLLTTIHYLTSLLPPYSVWKDPPHYHPLPHFPSPPYNVWKDRLLYHPLLHFPSSPIQCLKGPSSLPLFLPKFTWVFPQWTRPQSPQPVAGPHLSTNTHIMHNTVLTSDHLQITELIIHYSHFTLKNATLNNSSCCCWSFLYV